MKVLSIFLFLISSASFAGTFDYKDFSKFCKGQVVGNYGESMYCTKAPGYSTIIKSSRYKATTIPNKISGKMIDSIFDLEVLPDADTNPIYTYTSTLAANNYVVGYFVVEGFENYEIGTRVQVSSAYNMQGDLIFVHLNWF